jgi:hypothetical protein
MGSDSHNSKEQGPQSGGQSQGAGSAVGRVTIRPSNGVQDAALSYIKKLRKADPIRYERPKVTVIDKRG